MTLKPIVRPVLITLALSMLLLNLMNCGSGKGKKLPDGVHGVKIIQVQQAKKYSYFRVIENDSEFWLATEKMDLKTNDSLYYTRSYEMINFYSRDFDRTFPTIWFIQDPSGKLINPAQIKQQNDGPIHQKANQRDDQEKIDNINIVTPPGGTTIAMLYQNRDQYSGKKVVVKGLVTKINPEIMNLNWVHLQDGTNHQGDFDLTISTTEHLVEGAIVTVEGIIAVNKDFGLGYSYDVIMESARLLNTERAK